MLTSLTGDVDASEAHFARALIANAAAPLHVATTLRARGIARRRRGEQRGVADLVAAQDAYRTMGLTARTAQIESILSDRSDSDGSNTFVREGAVWRLTYAGRTTTVKHSKGMHDIAALLAVPITKSTRPGVRLRDRQRHGDRGLRACRSSVSEGDLNHLKPRLSSQVDHVAAP